MQQTSGTLLSTEDMKCVSWNPPASRHQDGVRKYPLGVGGPSGWLTNGKDRRREAGGKEQSQTAARLTEPQFQVREACVSQNRSAWGRVENSEGSSGALVNYRHGSRHDISKAARETWPIAIRLLRSRAFRSLQRLHHLQELGQKSCSECVGHVKWGNGHPLKGRGQEWGDGSLAGQRPLGTGVDQGSWG